MNVMMPAISGVKNYLQIRIACIEFELTDLRDGKKHTTKRAFPENAEMDEQIKRELARYARLGYQVESETHLETKIRQFDVMDLYLMDDALAALAPAPGSSADRPAADSPPAVAASPHKELNDEPPETGETSVQEKAEQASPTSDTPTPPAEPPRQPELEPELPGDTSAIGAPREDAPEKVSAGNTAAEAEGNAPASKTPEQPPATVKNDSAPKYTMSARDESTLRHQTQKELNAYCNKHGGDLKRIVKATMKQVSESTLNTMRYDTCAFEIKHWSAVSRALKALIKFDLANEPDRGYAVNE